MSTLIEDIVFVKDEKEAKKRIVNALSKLPCCDEPNDFLVSPLLRGLSLDIATAKRDRRRGGK